MYRWELNLCETTVYYMKLIENILTVWDVWCEHSLRCCLMCSFEFVINSFFIYIVLVFNNIFYNYFEYCRMDWIFTIWGIHPEIWRCYWHGEIRWYILWRICYGGRRRKDNTFLKWYLLNDKGIVWIRNMVRWSMRHLSINDIKHRSTL